MASQTKPFEDLLLVKEKWYDPCGLTMNSLEVESESKEYDACTFELGGKQILHRMSKITPTKTGQFVTLWKRNDMGITESFAASDDFDFACITARTENQLGQFIFPKQVLADKGILSKNGKGGKCGFRLYPPWDTASNKQAEKTQEWQSSYFVDLSSQNETAARERLTSLFSDSQK